MVNGIPTPVKTPKKKNMAKVDVAAKALFQDAIAESEVIAPSPRKGRKNKRYNGFSLESFKAEDEPGRVQIYTDNRDKVPEPDSGGVNPFVQQKANGEGSGVTRMASGSKRRKLSGARPVDAQVKAAIDRDEGMVYVL
jgi:hypothetical protein